MKKFFCTIVDKKYLPFGKTLLDSLRETCSTPFTLFCLCLDDESFEDLKDNPLAHCIRLQEVESFNEMSAAYKNTKSYNEYCWSLASTFCCYILYKIGTPHILYIDSDIFFYKDVQIVYDEIKDSSIGIIRHRHNTATSPDGEFNVGIVYFKNDEAGLSCAKWWNETMLLEKRPDLATIGDQKYLEEFPLLYGNAVAILDKTFAHGAPWNFRLYCYDNYPSKGTIIWGDREQPLVFNHFSRLSINEETREVSATSGWYRDHTLNFEIFNIPAVHHFYANYVSRLQRYYK
jgi:hypothetical protein|tara:strand:+ start:3800 stop:4666 length:867 start_codon:yes stop_codon:yes gene_type:complete